jgi:glycosyltransferase involved in cell wall biosynthesis
MRVSVVIPCHNVAEHIPKAFASVMQQTHPDLDVVCVDDGSTDDTPRVLAALVEAHPGRARVINQPNRGASAARNAGLRATTGPYVQFLDADDALHPDKIAAQMALSEREGLPDLVVGDFEQAMPDGLLLPVLALHGRHWMALIRTRMGTTSANLWKRDSLERAGGWNEEMASSQDYELMFRLLRNGARVVWDAHIRTQVLKRAHGSISRTGVEANWDRYIALRRAMKEHLEQADPKGYAEEIETLRQYIFMALRIVAAEDLPKALDEYHRSIGPHFRPEVSRAITERYAAMYKLLGFANTERLLRFMRRGRQSSASV